MSTRDWMERAVTREDLGGDKRTREDSFTDQLLDRMDGAIRERLEAIGRTLSNTGVSVSVAFESSNLTATEEHKYGADIGVRVTVRSPGFTSVKAVLIQCKRMYGPAGTPTFPELRGRGEEQAKKMLRITPASFFMLYSFGSQPSLIDLAGVPVGMMCPINDSLIPPTTAQALGSGCPFWHHSDGSIWDMGISLISASRVLAYSAAATGAGAPFPVDAATGATPVSRTGDHFSSSSSSFGYVGATSADRGGIEGGPGGRLTTC